LTCSWVGSPVCTWTFGEVDGDILGDLEGEGVC